MDLIQLGWNDHFESHFEPFAEQALEPFRVVRENKGNYIMLGRAGQLLAEVSGAFMHRSLSRAEFPAVGDWVAAAARHGEGRGTIHALLPRKSGFSRLAVLDGTKRRTGGKTDEQVLAANVDTVFLVSGLDGDFNVSRIERYLAIAWNSGATPVVILNKADLADDLDSHTARVEEIAFGVPVLAVSALANSGLDAFGEYLQPGLTVAFLGSSGVGKSTLINRLLGSEQLATQAVREYDSRGRHTTTHRELIVLPTGGIVIDTPGMREIQAWDDEDGLSRTFEDIESLAEGCRFADCRHVNEPGCAVQQALADGSLDAKRYRGYVKMQKELAHLQRRRNVKEQRQLNRENDRRIRQHFKAMKDLRKKGLA